MRTRGVIGIRSRAAIVSALLALMLFPAGAGATAQDVASTHAYLVASYRTLSAAVNKWPSVEASIRRLEGKLKGECANVGAGSPQNEEEQKFSYEAAGALWATGYSSQAAVIRPYISTLKRLKWSSPKITGYARRLAQGLQEMLALQVPDLCGDVRAWRANGFGTVPASVDSYGQHAESIEINEIPRNLLTRYVRPADRGLRASAERVATRFEELEFMRGQDDWLALLKAVGLNG